MPAKRKKERVVCKHFIWLIGQRNGVWFADGRSSNKQDPGRHSLGTRDRAEAVIQLRRLDIVKAVQLGLADAGELATSTTSALHFDEGVRLYMAHVRRPRVAGGAGPATAKRYRPVFAKSVAFFREQGLAAWNEIKKPHLEHYAAWLDGEGYAYATEFLELVTLKQAFRYWVEAGYLPSDHRINMPLTRPSGTDTHCWTALEVKAILDRCRSEPQLNWLYETFLALVCTGMRISELAGLRWHDVDLINHTISLKDESCSRLAKKGRARTTKNRHSRTFPTNPELEAVLITMKARADGGPIFKGPNGGALRPDSVRQALIKHVLEPLAAQFPSADDEIGFRDGRLHSCRHYFASVCARRGKAERVVMHWLGHRSSPMLARYFHLHDQESQRQMQDLIFSGSDET
jgi:integrase